MERLPSKFTYSTIEYIYLQLCFRSDVFGHILPLVGKDWSHDGIATFFQAIQENGYQFIYLSARAIGQSQITRNFLRNIKQCGCVLPNGPLLISPDTLVTALYRFVISLMY